MIYWNDTYSERIAALVWMQAIEVPDVTSIDPERLTVIGILVFIITGFVRGWLYTAPLVDKMTRDNDQRIKDKDEQIVMLRQDRDFYKSIALQVLQNNNKAIDIFQKTIQS